jgi:dihydrofolate reductase
MAKLRVHNLSMSLDGYVAGPEQSAENPLGVGGEALHEWVTATHSWRQAHGMEGGEEGTLDDRMARGEENFGATVMGRNMFGPPPSSGVRGPWKGDEWKGWWGDEPPFHHEVFVLTHHPREPLTMQGGTMFYFVTDGIDAALERAFASARGQDVRLGGGASAVQQYLRAGLLDEMHIAVVPVLLGGGEPLFADLGDAATAMKVVEFVNSPSVTHVRLARR